MMAPLAAAPTGAAVRGGCGAPSTSACASVCTLNSRLWACSRCASAGAADAATPPSASGGAAEGPPRDIMRDTGTKSLEDAFLKVVRKGNGGPRGVIKGPPRRGMGRGRVTRKVGREVEA